MARYVSIWFRYLLTDAFALQKPGLKQQPFVLAMASHGRLVITAANALARNQAVYPGMVVADARALIPSLQVFDDNPATAPALLKRIALWCIRFTPVVTVDLPDGVILDATGCTHLWGGDEQYINNITAKIAQKGFEVRVAIADTIGAAWAAARFSRKSLMLQPGNIVEQVGHLPVEGLRLEPENIELLRKLGLKQINDLVTKPKTALRRRFGETIVKRMQQLLGEDEELINSVVPIEPYQERLPCIDSIVTAIGIEIALKKLLGTLCNRLIREQLGLRSAELKCYRVDGKIEEVGIATISASNNTAHLFKLFEPKLTTIEPALGIELFVLTAQKVEEHIATQQKLWETTCGLQSTVLAELVDRLAGKVGVKNIHRYLPAAHYWPEFSFNEAHSLTDVANEVWLVNKPRPVQLLQPAEKIEVTAPVPDYPPMLFRHKGRLHKIVKADGPERIEQEWWLQQGEHRDYYTIEDEAGCRYWLYRLGHYNNEKPADWFLHGVFA